MKIKGQINNKKELCGGTAYFDIDMWKTLISNNLEISYKGKGLYFEISLPADEIIKFIQENE